MTDSLTGVTDGITYCTSGPGIGQPSVVSESGGNLPAYTVSYSYAANPNDLTTGMGDRSTVTYATPNSTTTWGYFDFQWMGKPSSPSHVFQTLCQLDSSGNRTPEEYHYTYDTDGRVLEAAFAQTPVSGYTPPAGKSYYDNTHLPTTRARAQYAYDPAGRVLSVEHFWDTYNSGAYSSTPIIGNVCSYEVSTNASALNRGVKLSRATVINSGGTWSTERTDNYGYDTQRDFLTNETLTGNSWSYDPAGNRNDVSVDNLNRITKTGAVSATSDILGNVTNMGGLGYTWDCLNRMTQFVGQQENYEYRADGMRVAKSTTFNNQNKSTTYRYDGQMGIEDVDLNNGATTVTDYAVGARGVDAISVTNSSGTTVSYPLYDSHGNMISTLSKGSQAGTFSYSAERVYDAWGNITSGNGSGDPKGRYCANLGHKQDDESGLIHMRARYYDPAHGRFISQDPQRDGLNWFIYAGNTPCDAVDQSGARMDLLRFCSEFMLWTIGTALTLSASMLVACGGPEQIGRASALATLGVAAIAASLTCSTYGWEMQVALGIVLGTPVIRNAIAAVVSGASGGGLSEIDGPAIAEQADYSLIVIGFLVADMADDAIQNPPIVGS